MTLLAVAKGGNMIEKRTQRKLHNCPSTASRVRHGVIVVGVSASLSRREIAAQILFELTRVS
jgi:hypothetical protein